MLNYRVISSANATRRFKPIILVALACSRGIPSQGSQSAFCHGICAVHSRKGSGPVSEKHDSGKLHSHEAIVHCIAFRIMFGILAFRGHCALQFEAGECLASDLRLENAPEMIGPFGTLASTIVIPRNVEVLGPSCFSDCESLSSITFESESRLTRIDTHAFQDTKLDQFMLYFRYMSHSCHLWSE
jgi:hypothetical protein